MYSSRKRSQLTFMIHSNWERNIVDLNFQWLQEAVLSKKSLSLTWYFQIIRPLCLKWRPTLIVQSQNLGLRWMERLALIRRMMSMTYLSAMFAQIWCIHQFIRCNTQNFILIWNLLFFLPYVFLVCACSKNSFFFYFMMPT